MHVAEGIPQKSAERLMEIASSLEPCLQSLVSRLSPRQLHTV